MPDIVDDVLAAWERYADELADLPNVVSVGMGYRVRGGKRTRTPALVVTVRRKVGTEQLGPSTMVPREVPLPNGRTVEVDVVEDPQEYTVEQDTATYRPVAGGCEIGRFGSGSVGTLGGWFCRRRDDRSGWGPVWLTNAHVASGNSSTIPADARITQPGGGGVIGSTTALVGYPTPGPAAGVTVNAVCDAAIGALDEGVDPDYQVLQIAPAPFEIGTAASGQAVQKRGRTSLRTDGTVDGTAGMPPWITVDMASPNSAGTVRFGSPGNPRVYRVRSNAAGLAAAFTRPGDSGSLYLASQAGRLASTFPALGLHFAGTFTWVSQQTNPNAFTVTSVGFDLGGVMGQFQLDTVCNCVLRAILDAIFGPGRWARELSSGGESTQLTRHAEGVMRRFRDQVLSRTKVGKQIADAVAQTAPDVSRVLSQDPIAFGLAVDLLRPWATASTSFAVLAKEVDADTIRTARELAERVVQLAPETEERIRPMLELLEGREGEPVRKLLGRQAVPKLPPVERAKPRDAR
jgi:hypothetical protein